MKILLSFWFLNYRNVSLCGLATMSQEVLSERICIMFLVSLAWLLTTQVRGSSGMLQVVL
jgi:hypothetical protein